jgi:putative FmdB family regulatory protein
MPIYEYECQSCGGVVEVLQAMGAAPPESCSRCGGRLERMLSPPSLNLNQFTSRSAARHAKLTAQEQARQERDRLLEHSQQTGIPFNDLFEVHD